MTTKEQQKANRKILADALRSGKYKQGRKCLREDDKFCCLGVAMDIFSDEEWRIESRNRYAKGEFGYWLSPEVKEKLGFPNDVGFCAIEEEWDKLDSLANFNDAGYSFEQIADIIENTDWEASKAVLDKKLKITIEGIAD